MALPKEKATTGLRRQEEDRCDAQLQEAEQSVETEGPDHSALVPSRELTYSLLRTTIHFAAMVDSYICAGMWRMRWCNACL